MTMPNFVCIERLTYGPWPAFERLVARLARHAGFKDVSIVGGAGDRGADVVGTIHGKRWVFQAKYRMNGLIGSEGAREAVRASNAYLGEVAVAVANASFTQEAYEYLQEAKRSGIDLRLWSGSTLLQYFERLPHFSPERRPLRDYQEQAVESIEARRGEGHPSGLVIMATGLGKSVVANQLVVNELARNPDQEVLVLAHMVDLVRQLEISSWPQLGKDVSTHLWTDGEVPSYPGGVVFATWQTVAAALQRGEPLSGRFGLVIVDEAHHAPSVQFSHLLNALAPNFLVGLTATPWRGDDQSLADLFGPPAFTMDIVEGMQRGFLSSVDYRMLTDGIDWEHISALSEQGLTISDLNQYLLVPERDMAMVDLICAEMAGLESPRALAFCRSIDHAEYLRPLFLNKGIRAALLHSGLSREERFKNLTSFRKGEIDLLISIEMLNEGIDVPEVNLVAFMRVTHSRRIFIQQLGRGLRLSPGKPSVRVLDFVADIRRVAAGMELNRRAKQREPSPEIVHHRDGEIVKFDDHAAGAFFEKYLRDVADVENLGDGARLKFPGGEEF